MPQKLSFGAIAQAVRFPSYGGLDAELLRLRLIGAAAIILAAIYARTDESGPDGLVGIARNRDRLTRAVAHGLAGDLTGEQVLVPSQVQPAFASPKYLW